MHRKTGIISMLALSSFLLCGATAPVTCKPERIGPSTGEVVGVAVGIGAAITIGVVVLVEVHKSHHQIKGCVTTGPNGLQVENESDKKLYLLVGAPVSIKAGDIVRVHGDKQKQPKGSTAAQNFKIEKLNKDYGACKVPPVPSTN